jgi:hypothetical protein
VGGVWFIEPFAQRIEVCNLTWRPSLAEQQPLLVTRVGLRRDEARFYLTAAGGNVPRYVIRLVGVYKIYDSLTRGREVQISDEFPHGTFGWDAPDGAPHHSVKITVDGDASFFMALTREVEFGMADRDEAMNWPG